jgi:hypothetical protein
MKAPKPLPPAPPVTLPAGIATAADYIAAHYGIPHTSAVVALLAAAGSVVGDQRTVSWRGETTKLTLPLLLTPEPAAECRGWLDLIAAPLEKLMAQLTARSATWKNPQGHLEGLQAEMAKHPEGSPERAEAVQRFVDGALAFSPYFVVRQFTARDERVYRGSPLLIDATGNVLREATTENGVRLQRLMVPAAPGENMPMPQTLLMVADGETLDELKRRGQLAIWSPAILPQGGGAFGTTTITRDEADKAWGLVVQQALAIRRGPAASIGVTTYGLDTINGIRSRAETASRAIGQAFRWAVGTCLKLAGIIHGLNRDAGEAIGIRTWDDARQLTEWLMVAHAHALGHLRLKLGRKKRGPAPARPDDVDRLVRRMAARQSTSYRQLVQALPRRAKGYWRAMHQKAIMGELRRP